MNDLDFLPALADDEDLVPSPIVKKENGRISDMTLWRWTRDPRIRFPPPDVVINGRKYWKRKTLRQHRQRILSELGGQAPEREPKATRARGVKS